MNLVVGATGQLGRAIVEQLGSSGQPTRALVRPGSRYGQVRPPGVEIVEGDLRDQASLARACQGATAVLATANAVTPEGAFEAVEGQGYRNLIAAAKLAGVKQFVFVSV